LPHDESIFLECDEVTHDSESNRGLYRSSESLYKYISSGYKGFYPFIVKVSKGSDEVFVIVVEPPQKKLVRGLFRKELFSFSWSYLIKFLYHLFEFVVCEF
jgi:hypothetical protein